MPWYVYIIESVDHSIFYKGCTTDYQKRLDEHNAGLSKYTSGKTPWRLRYVEVHEQKTEALKREKMLKRQNRRYLEWLITQPTNVLLLPPGHGRG